MKNVIGFFCGFIICVNVFAAPTGNGRSSLPVYRATASRNDISASSLKSSIKTNIVSVVQEEVVIDDRAEEKKACINNNTGVSNMFVWASKYSSTDNYTTMIEDTENPDNNVCFVRVELKSSDSKIDMSDFSAKYFILGDVVSCGSWVNEEMLEKKILEAKKTNRAWATVGGVLGGVAVGVGSMELFGNKLIGGKVQGLKDTNLSPEDVFYAKLMILKEKSISDFNQLQEDAKIVCKNDSNKTKDLCKAWLKIGLN